MSNPPQARATNIPDLELLSELAPQLAQTFVSIASDIALVIDDSGVVRNVYTGAEPLAGSTHEWIGRPWTDTVTGECRHKAELLLNEALAGGVTLRREVNHRNQSGNDIPVAYAAVRLGRSGPVLAVGRDLRAVSAIQQRFIDAQQAMERDYWRQRQAESRYRMLFQVATDGVMVVDSQTLRIVEANSASARLLRRETDALVGQPATIGMAPVTRAAVEELLVTARTTGRPGEIRALVATDGPTGLNALAVDVSATPFRADDAMMLLVRVRVADRPGLTSAIDQRLVDFVEHTPDAVVITDSHGRVLMANPAFSQLCDDPDRRGEPLGRQPYGRTIDELLGDPKRQLPQILTEVRRHGIAELRQVEIGHVAGLSIQVEVSAALLAEGDQECIGLMVRRVDQRLAHLQPQLGQIASAVGRLAAQVGIVPLPELLQETTDLAERHLIDAAIARAGGNRLQAASLLGVSVEYLWLRMRHHGMAPDTAYPSSLLN